LGLFGGVISALTCSFSFLPETCSNVARYVALKNYAWEFQVELKATASRESLYCLVTPDEPISEIYFLSVFKELKHGINLLELTIKPTKLQAGQFQRVDRFNVGPEAAEAFDVANRISN
jgi:prephenate dehydratase